MKVLTNNQKLSKDKIEVYVAALKEAQIPPDKIVDNIESLLRTQSEVELQKAEIGALSRKQWSKTLLIIISTLFIVTPLFFAENPLAVTAIASLGAVGFATALFDTFGSEAAKFGKTFRNFFQSNDGNK